MLTGARALQWAAFALTTYLWGGCALAGSPEPPIADRAGAPYATGAHHLVEAVAWEPSRPAERVNDHILMSRGTSASYLVTTKAGDVVINTGMPYQGARHRERFEALLGRPLKVRKIIFTQHHPDHVGGWEAFNDSGVEIVAQTRFPNLRRERAMLAPFFAPRSSRIVGALAPSPEHQRAWFRQAAEPPTHILVDDVHAFELGGRKIEVHAAPGGEGLDGLIVVLPADRAVFTGNLTGALYMALPHLYTLRGDRQRGATQFIGDIEHVLSFKPELLLTGHDDPIRGEARVRADLTKVRDAVAYIHDETVKGMNAQKDLPTLMAEIKLPNALEPAPGRGPVWWYVRAVWEEYTGWFRQESTTELYPTPARAVWPEVVALAGGPDVLAEGAARHVAAGRPVEALHLLDMSLSVDPSHRASRLAQAQALEMLIQRTQGRTYDELAWLEGELAKAKAVLDGK